MPDPFDVYHRWLGIPPGEQPPTAYRLLGLRPLESDPEVIANAADRQTLHLRTFQLGRHSELSERLLNEVAAARVLLLDPERKARYDRQLCAETQPATPTPAIEESFPSSAGPALLGVPRPATPAPRRPATRRRRRRLPSWALPAAGAILFLGAIAIFLVYAVVSFLTGGRTSVPPPEPAEPAAQTIEPPKPPPPRPKPPIVIDSPLHRPPPPSGPAGNQRKSP